MDKLERWVDGVLEIIQEVHQRKPELLKESFRLPGGADFYVEVLQTLAQKEVDSEILQCFSPSAEPDNIIEQLDKPLSEERFDKSYAGAVRLMIRIGGDWSWGKLVKAIDTSLKTTNALQPSHLVGCLRAMMYLTQVKTQPDSKAVLQELCTNGGYLMHHLHHAKANNNKEAMSLCILPILESNPEGNIQNPQGQANQGRQIYNEIIGGSNQDVVQPLAQLTIELRRAEGLIDNASGAANIRPLVSSIIELIIQEDNAYEHVPSSTLTRYYTELKQMIDEAQLNAHIEQLVEGNVLLSYLAEGQDFDAGRADLYLKAFNATQAKPESEDYLAFLVHGLQTISQELWIKELRQELDLLELMVALVNAGAEVNLSESYHDALLEHARQILAGNTHPAKFEKRWDPLVEALAEDWRPTFLRDLRDELIDQANQTCAPALALYGNALLQSNVLDEDADRVVRRWFTEIVERRDSREVTWLDQVMREKIGIFNNSPSETQSSFRQRVKSAWESTEDEKVKPQLRAIAESIGLRLEDEPSETNVETTKAVEATESEEEA